MLTSIKHSLLHNSSFDVNLFKSLIPRSKKKQQLYITSHRATGFLTQLDSISFLQKKK